MKLSNLIIAALFLITACAGGNKTTPQKAKEINNIGVSSSFDNVFHIYLKGAHSYDDVHKEIKMPDWWNLNKPAFKAVKGYFAGKKVEKLSGDSVPQVLSQAKQKGLDTAIIITPLPLNVEPIMNYGMAKLSEEKKQGFLIFDITVYDVKSGSKISSGTGLAQQDSVYFDLPLDFREFFNYHKDEVEKIQKTYDMRVSTRIAYALKDMGF